MKVITSNNINDADKEYPIKVNTKNDVLDSINFKNDIERRITSNVIDVIERLASFGAKNMKVVSLPYTGTYRVNPVRNAIKKYRYLLKIARSRMTKEEYKTYVRGLVREVINDNTIKNNAKETYKLIMKNNKVKYAKLAMKHGIAYAEMYIFSIYLMDVVEYNQDFEDVYAELSKDRASE